MLILLFLYLGLIALRSSLDDEALAGKLTAILAVVGVIILPVIKFSVDYWNTLHQPSTRFTSTLDLSFRIPLLVMAAGFLLVFIAMHLKAMRNEILRRRVRALTIGLVERARADARDTGPGLKSHAAVAAPRVE
jgi:heme exporter protein C